LISGTEGHASSLKSDTYGHLMTNLEDLERRPAEQL